MCDHPTFTKILTVMDEAGELDQISMTSRQSTVIQHMWECHTEACGFTREECENCGYSIPSIMVPAMIPTARSAALKRGSNGLPNRKKGECK